MENLERVLVLLFKHVSAKMVIDGKRLRSRDFRTGEEEFSGMYFPEDEFVKLAFHYMTEYSETELANMWEHFEKECQDGVWPQVGMRNIKMPHSINVFKALFHYVKHMLIIQKNEVLCQYNELLQWRKLTIELSEDFLVAAYLACEKTPEEMDKRGFQWKLVIGHNNFQLNHIVERGISENHFHLYGSAPMFHLSWISLMNNLSGSKTAEFLREYDQDRRYANIRYSINYAEETLVNQYRQAALIRLFLFVKLTEREYVPDSLNEENVSAVLQDQLTMEATLDEMQQYIDVLRSGEPEMNGASKQAADYILFEVQKSSIGSNVANDIFSGERWFLYMCMNRIYRGEFSEKETNFFYAYILLKETLRSEIIQSNKNVGFLNFEKYQRRKMKLIDDTIYNDEIVKWAVRDNLLAPYVKALEIRISPADSAVKNHNWIQKLDKIIGPEKERYFYVFHFVKSKDEKSKTAVFGQYRHYKLRNRVEKTAGALSEFRQTYPLSASRVLGIDAAGNELGCRPEVFASVFRYLKKHEVIWDDGFLGKRIPQLRITYHVGEDFLDIVDGLRAIDEAINFINMECGDRLGHVLALGVDVEEWYRSKNYHILISQQDYLDNIVWLYQRIIQFQLTGFDDLKSYLERKFSDYFEIIYGANMLSKDIEAILRNWEAETKKKGKRHLFYSRTRTDGNRIITFDIHQYYHAWKLRGDHPKLYEKGYFSWEEDIDERNNSYVNSKFPKAFAIRDTPEIFLLNYYYHFNNLVWEEGERKIEITIKPSYIRGVKAVQKEMQNRIARRGLAIETNPSSNYLIGTFKSYEKHPIVTFYNQGLTTDAAELNDCPQLYVSINTDDKGVFSTSLENEYALMAKALENETDENGNPKYKKIMVYNWIDSVRKMGNEQSFQENFYQQFPAYYKRMLELDAGGTNEEK